MPASCLALRRADTLSGQPPQAKLERSQLGDVAIEGCLGRDALGLALGLHRPVVERRARAVQSRCALGAVAAHQFDLAGALQVADACACRRVRAAAAPPCPRRKSSSPAWSPGTPRPRCRPSTAKPRGLSRSEAILARNLLQESPIDTVMPSASLDLDCKARKRLRRRSSHASAPLQKIHKCLVDRYRLDQRRKLEHEGADLASDAGIFFHVRPYHHGLQRQGAETPRTSASPILLHRCGRRSRRSAQRRDGEPPTITGLSASERIVAFLDRGIEGVAIDMGDRERVDLGMAQKPRRAARQHGGRIPQRASRRQSRQNPGMVLLNSSVPIPKFAQATGTLWCELGIKGTLATL